VKRYSLAVHVLVLIALFGLPAGGCSPKPSQATRTAVGEADQRVVAGMSGVSRAMALQYGNEPLTESGIGSAGLAADAAESDMAASREAILRLPDSVGRKHFLEALDKYDAIAGSAVVSVDLTVAWMVEKQGMEDLQAAIASNNKRDYAQMSAKAQAAADRFATAKALFAKWESITALRLQGFVSNAELRRQSATAFVEAAKYRRSGSEDRYAAALDEGTSLTRRFSASAESVSEPIGWLLGRATQTEQEADELRKQALEELGVGVSDAWIHGQLNMLAKEATGTGG
jgi:hypothetical protein